MSNPEIYAQNFLEDLGIDSYPVDPFEICSMMGIRVFQEDFQGLEGVLLFNGKSAAIGLNKNQPLLSRQKFSIAHELGHFTMDIKVGEQKVFKCTKSMIETYDKSQDIELRADQFASELILPSKLTSPLIRSKDPSWDLIKQIANDFEVSLIPSAIKFITTTDRSCCLVVSKDNKIQFYQPSKQFRYGLQMDSRILSEQTIAYRCMKNLESPDNFQLLPADNWISGIKVTKDSELYEWSLPVNRYGTVLTILWDDETVDVGDDTNDWNSSTKDRDEKNYSFGGVDNFPWEPPTFHRKK